MKDTTAKDWGRGTNVSATCGRSQMAQVKEYDYGSVRANERERISEWLDAMADQEMQSAPAKQILRTLATKIYNNNLWPMLFDDEGLVIA